MSLVLYQISPSISMKHSLVSWGLFNIPLPRTGGARSSPGSPGHGFEVSGHDFHRLSGSILPAEPTGGIPSSVGHADGAAELGGSVSLVKSVLNLLSIECDLRGSTSPCPQYRRKTGHRSPRDHARGSSCRVRGQRTWWSPCSAGCVHQSIQHHSGSMRRVSPDDQGSHGVHSPMMWYNGAASAATHSPLGRRPHWPSSTRARVKEKPFGQRDALGKPVVPPV